MLLRAPAGMAARPLMPAHRSDAAVHDHVEQPIEESLVDAKRCLTGYVVAG